VRTASNAPLPPYILTLGQVRLTNALSLVVIVAHYIACLMMMVASFSSNPADSLLAELGYCEPGLVPIVTSSNYKREDVWAAVNYTQEEVQAAIEAAGMERVLTELKAAIAAGTDVNASECILHGRLAAFIDEHSPLGQRRDPSPLGPSSRPSAKLNSWPELNAESELIGPHGVDTLVIMQSKRIELQSKRIEQLESQLKDAQQSNGPREGRRGNAPGFLQKQHGPREVWIRCVLHEEGSGTEPPMSVSAHLGGESVTTADPPAPTAPAPFWRAMWAKPPGGTSQAKAQKEMEQAKTRAHEQEQKEVRAASRLAARRNDGVAAATRKAAERARDPGHDRMGLNGAERVQQLPPFSQTVTSDLATETATRVHSARAAAAIMAETGAECFDVVDV
jgi:hypothetical protein